MKHKLDTIWQDVQASLPEINFDNDATDHDDNLDIKFFNNSLDDLDESDSEQNFEKFLTRGDQFNENQDQTLEDADMDDIVIVNSDKADSDFSQVRHR